MKDHEPSHLSTFSAFSHWWPLVFGWFALMVPTAWRFSQTVWQSGEQSFGPFVLLVSLYLFWMQRGEFDLARRPRISLPGWAGLFVGLVMYVFGVMTKIAVLEGASHLVVALAAIWLIGGARLVRVLWFPLLYMLLIIPIPSYLMAALTGGLKQFVSAVAEWALYTAGYPIARNGVTLTIGSYQLLVADACSGMNSILSLTAVGLLFIRLVQPARIWQVALLAAAIIPIAIVANIVRVMVLVLITYYLGDEAGQGFLHEFSGLMMFVIAVGVLVGLDHISRRFTGIGSKEAVHG